MTTDMKQVIIKARMTWKGTREKIKEKKHEDLEKEK